MSQKVLTFNLILSTSKELIETALSSRSFTDLQSDSRFSDSKTFKFFTLNKNKSLLSFEYEISRVAGSIFKLEFLDYDGFFEYNFISSNINDFILNYVNKTYSAIRDTTGNLNAFSNFYISFGTSLNFKEWSGPFSVFLLKSDYEFSEEGVKKILLTFAQTEGPAASTLSKTDKAQSKYKSKFTTTPITQIIEANYLDIKDPYDLEVKLFDNKVFPELISNYIKAYTNQESIVLIPDMMEYFNYYQSLKSTRSSSRGKAKTPIFPYLTELECNSFFSEFGLNFEMSLVNPKKTPLKITTITDQNQEKEEKRASEAKYTYALSMKVTTAESQIARGGTYNEFVDGYIPLQKMSEGLSKLSNTKSTSNYSLYEESDTNILKLWKEIGLIKDDTLPVIIWGRTDYILNVLYPKFGSFDSQTTLYQQLKAKLNKEYSLSINKSYIQSYNSDFKETLGNNLTDFSVKSFRTIELNEKSVKDFGIPVFKSNIKNPNVLAYNFSNFKTNLGILQSLVFSITENAIQDAATYVDPKASFKDKIFQHTSIEVYKFLDPKKGALYSEKLINLLDKAKPQNTATPISRINERTFPLLKLGIKSYADFMKFLEEKKDTRVKKNINKVISNNFENPIQAQQKLNLLMSNQVVNLNIRTLPFFSITGTKFIAFPCLFLQKLFNNWVSPIAGIYSILGIKHVVNSEEMYSEFELTKEGLGTSDID